MSQNAEWKLDSPPNTEVQITEDVLGLRAPLVRVHRGDSGGWTFTGPDSTGIPAQITELRAVVDAWPHVAGIPALEYGNAASWSWLRHGWQPEFECRCGNCAQPTAADLDRQTWPADLQPNRVLSVEQDALAGSVPMTNIIFPEGGIAVLGPGEQRRTSEDMAPVAMANAIRRWPHTMQAFRALQEGRGMHWHSSELHWHEYVIA